MSLIGKKVRLSEEYKKLAKERDCIDHTEEFGDCIGIVEGFFDEHLPPIYDVRWYPKMLRYAYNPEDLEVVE